MYCTTYTEKSIVVRGETRDHKEELKNLGGKWNAKLTDKSTEEQFGGWIFPTSKHEKVKKWLVSVTTSVVQSSTPQITGRSTSDSNIQRLEMGIKKIEGIIKNLGEVSKVVEVLKSLSLDFENIKKEYKSNVESSSMVQTSNFMEEDEVEQDGPPPKRLLGKK